MNRDIVLGDEINVLSGCPFDSRKFTSEPVGKQLIRIRDLQTFASDTNFSGDYSTEFIVTKGDILIGMDGDFHIVKWKGKDGLLNQRILKLLPKLKSNVELSYIYYRLQPLLLEINDKTAATTVKHLSTNDIKWLPLTVPPRPAQQKIAKILSTIEGQIEKTEAIIAKYQAVKQGMLQDLFTRGIDISTGELRPRYEDAPKLYKDSPLGMIPKEWEAASLGQICQMKSGDGITSESISEVGEYPVYGGNGLRGYSSQYTHDGYYVLIGRQGALCGNITKASGKFYASEHAVVVTLFEQIDTDWLAEKLEMMTLNRYSEASAQPGLSVAKILRLQITKPPHDEQKSISAKVVQVNNKLRTEQKNLDKIKFIKQGLMSDLLSGKVEVKNMMI